MRSSRRRKRKAKGSASRPSSRDALRRPQRPRRARKENFWVNLPDHELLDVRLCDLGLKMEGTVIEDRVRRLHDELDERGIKLRPHVWLSSEWFSPDGVPGVALPFYLAHERLMKLEAKMFLEVEGGPERQCMKLLRHEAGHAICTGYRLHYRPSWRAVFGHYTEPYGDFYQPRPFSRNFVLHLDRWYAQAHPAEDFAETFAVWLSPTSRWRQQYRGWKALKKIEFVNELMHDIAGKTPPVRSRETPYRISKLRMTLREHYRIKRREIGDEWPDFYDRDLRRLFSDHPRFADRETAAAFLRRYRPHIRQVVGEWTGEYLYTIDQVLRDMIDRCKELKLRLMLPEREARLQAMIMVTVQTMNYLHGGRHRIAL